MTSARKIIVCFIALTSAYIVWWYLWPLSPAMMVSVSSNGQYVISSHQNRTIVLWDIEHQQKKILSRFGNIYSAYFINDDTYMYQTLLLGRVKVKNLRGKTLNSFRHFPVYGHVMSQDLQHYIASTQAWDLYLGYGKKQRMIKDSYEFNGFYTGKLFNLSLSDEGNLLLTAGDSAPFDDLPLEAGHSNYEAHRRGFEKAAFGEHSLLEGVVLWDTKTGKPLHKFLGNKIKTYATLSPDGRYVVSGDESSNVFVWNTHNGERTLEHYSLLHGRWIPPAERKTEDKYFDNSEMTLFPPKDFTDLRGSFRRAVLSLKFIDNSDYYLRFTTYIPYAILYHIDDPKPLAYLALEGERPSVDAYVRNASIDTAPHTNILVTGQSTGHGINVYRYDPTEQALTLEWVAE